MAEALDTQEPEVALTEYTPLVVATYVVPVAPVIAVPLLYHWLPVAADDVSVTLLPVQNVVAPVVVTVGVAGVVVTITVVAADIGEKQPFVPVCTV